MGTRIDVYMSHDLPNVEDTAATLSRLENSLDAASSVQAYWKSTGQGVGQIDRWTPNSTEAGIGSTRIHRFTGPGSLYLQLTPLAACMFTGARWRGFLTIEPLRRVHLAAFRRVADCLGSRSIAICHDSCDAATDAFWSGHPQEVSVAALRSAYGTSQPSLDDIAWPVATEAERTVPNVWYLEERSGS